MTDVVPSPDRPQEASQGSPAVPGREPERRLASTPRRAELEDEMTFLRLSLEDLDRELAGGELARKDYDELHASYENRARAVAEELERLDEQTVRPLPRPRRRRFRLAARRRRIALGWAAAGCFAAAGLLVGLAVAGVAPFARASANLSARSRIDIELAEAAVLASHGHLGLAVDTYDKVLELDPEQPQALTDGGWLVRLVGLSTSRPALVARGDREIAAAAVLDPHYALARGYEGVALLVDRHDPRAAAAAFDVMLSEHPAASLVASVRADAVRAFAAVDEPLPRAFEH